MSCINRRKAGNPPGTARTAKTEIQAGAGTKSGRQSSTSSLWLQRSRMLYGYESCPCSPLTRYPQSGTGANRKSLWEAGGVNTDKQSSSPEPGTACTLGVVAAAPTKERHPERLEFSYRARQKFGVWEIRPNKLKVSVLIWFAYECNAHTSKNIGQKRISQEVTEKELNALVLANKPSALVNWQEEPSPTGWAMAQFLLTSADC